MMEVGYHSYSQPRDTFSLAILTLETASVSSKNEEKVDARHFKAVIVVQYTGTLAAVVTMRTSSHRTVCTYLLYVVGKQQYVKRTDRR